jgi:dipeptidyl-peptidase-4
VQAEVAGTVPLTIERIYGDTSLSGVSPRGVKLSPDGKRVGYLRGRKDDQYQLDLWVYDATDHESHLLVDSKVLLPQERLSAVERARRERARTASYRGILNYHWSQDGQKLLFPLGDTLYLCEFDAGTKATLRRLVGGESVVDPQISPNGGYVSFLRDQNLFVIELASGSERQLTFDGGGAVHNAEAEFISQEEMGESRGYWWAPDDSQIAFKQFDESPVPIIRRFEIYADSTSVVEQRYPGAGEPNVTVKLGLVRPTRGEVRWINLGDNPDIYLPRVKWFPDGTSVCYQRQSRDQKLLELIAVDASTFEQRLILTETSDTWVNLHDDLHFLESRSEFVWSSERSGFNHLYLYNLDGSLLRPLTAGEWDVDGLLDIDESSGLVYFASNRDTIIDKRIYTVRLDDPPGEPVLISSGSGWHEATFPDEADTVFLYVDRYSDPKTPPQTSVRGPDGTFLAWVEENRLGEHHPYWRHAGLHANPEFGTIPAEDGQLLQYGMLKPPDFDSTRQYPVVVSVYGGPTSQSVSRSWTDMFSQYLAQQGYIVFELDNRGTARRGRRFADALYHRMGDVEVRDQLTGIEWLKSRPYVNPSRIAVNGWSYGGYMAVMLLAKAGDRIAAAVAGAPVTDWRIYDTHYTEHYLGTPQENPDGYDSSAVFGALEGITSPLLLIHGMADDNVLFVNSTELIEALQKQGTQFRLMTYPGGKHGLSTPAMQKHVHHLMMDFFDETLKRTR